MGAGSSGYCGSMGLPIPPSHGTSGSPTPPKSQFPNPARYLVIQIVNLFCIAIVLFTSIKLTIHYIL